MTVDDPFVAIGRSRHRRFAREFVRLRRSIGLEPDEAAREAVNIAFCAYVQPERALAKAHRLLANPLIAAVIDAARR
jgi:hypothetical protein